MEETTAFNDVQTVTLGTSTEIFTQITQNQTDMLVELRSQNEALSEISQVLWWVFFILLAYGIYKIFLGNLLSWFNGS